MPDNEFKRYKLTDNTNAIAPGVGQIRHLKTQGEELPISEGLENLNFPTLGSNLNQKVKQLLFNLSILFLAVTYLGTATMGTLIETLAPKACQCEQAKCCMADQGASSDQSPATVPPTSELGAKASPAVLLRSVGQFSAFPLVIATDPFRDDRPSSRSFEPLYLRYQTLLI